jgi:hypothetical protein
VTVRSSLLGTANVSDSSAHVLYTVPAGYRTIVKSIIVKGGATAASRAAFRLLRSGTALANFSAFMSAINTSGDTVFLLPWLVMNAGDSLDVTFSAAAGGWVAVSGTELLL